ncbi:Phage tail protein OS=Bosea thiooxidans OX=53254 GN=SAMN05660750_03312 PE=4 SV=1 [Bosea thiooxidans]
MAAINLPFAASATKRAPNADELANGFPCGDADKQLFDWFLTVADGSDRDGHHRGRSDRRQRAPTAARAGHPVRQIDLCCRNRHRECLVVARSSACVPAYAAGRVLNVIAPATNTSTTVNADISGLGNRRVKKSDGSDPAVGDLVAGRVYATIDDGTNIRILTPLPSDAVAAVAAAAPVGGNWIWSQNLANNVITTSTAAPTGAKAANLQNSPSVAVFSRSARRRPGSGSSRSRAFP